MRCPILGFLPEIVDVAHHLDGPKSEAKLLAMAQNVCRACREKSLHGKCPLSEPFGSALQCCLAEIVKMVERLLKERGD